MERFTKTVVFRIKDRAIFEVPLIDEILIGSKKDCDFVIPFLSKEQCRIIKMQDKIIIQNISDDNSVVMNGVEIAKNESQILNNGVLTIGKISFVVAIRDDSFDSRIKMCNKCESINGYDATVCRKCGASLETVIPNERQADPILSKESVVEEKANDISYSVKNKQNDKKMKIAVGVAAAIVVLIGIIIGVIIKNSVKSGANEEFGDRDGPSIINLSNVNISLIEDQLYTGLPIYCSFEVASDDVVLVEGEDYTCIYENNTGVGLATVTISGNDVTTIGSTETTFKIVTGDSVCDDSQNREVVAFVERLYVYPLDRYPERDVLVSYVNQLVNHETTAPDLVNIVYNSGEFTNRNLSDEDYLTTVYRSVLNRDPDEGGFDSNLTLLGSGTSRYDLTNNITRSSEFETLCESIGIIANYYHYIASLDVGDTFYFGANNGEPIKWMILEVEGDEIFVISTELVGLQMYDNDEENWSSSWTNSSLREWMNSDFFNSAFSSEEQSYIAYTDNGYDVPNHTDRLFLLSYDEFNSIPDEYRACEYEESTSSWWLYEARLVNDIGVAHRDGQYRDFTPRGVRPVMWLNFSRLLSEGRNTPEYITSLGIGDTFYYGNYQNLPIEWVVLANQDNRVFAITYEAIDRLPFQDEYVEDYYDLRSDVTWENSTLRSWLNNEYFNSAFSESEQNRIEVTHVTAEYLVADIYTLDGTIIPTDPGNDTEDRVFLLSESEIQQIEDTYADFLSISSAWWIRNSGSGYANTYGNGYLGTQLYFHYDGVRPAIWINFEQ